ncbi:class I adenylate-forming enzyme family protein [Dietzia sp. NPDC055877]
MNITIQPDTVTSIWDYLSRRAAMSGEATAVVDEHGRRLTFAEVVSSAERVAAGLLGLGIGPGSTVSWQLPTSIDTIVLSMALCRLGAVQNPIISLYRGREVAHMLEQCRSEWIITVGEFRGFDHAAMAEELSRASEGALRALVVDGRLPDGDPDALPPAPPAGEEIRWIYTTSGTTSAPKGVCHTDDTLIAGGVALADAVGYRADDVGTIFFPYAHIGGPDMLIASLATGMALVVMEAYEPVAAVELMRREGVTATGGSTPHYALLLAEQRKNPGSPVVPTLRLVAGGGAPMPASLFREFRAEVGVPILHAYGMTECPTITSARFDDTDEQLAETEGRPVLGCELQIRDEDDVVLPDGEAGRVWLRGTMLFNYYRADGEDITPFDEQGWMFTGDVGRIEPDGHLVLVGREKDLIIRKGESISPSEIEAVLSKSPDVVDIAVIGLPDEQSGERICAVIQTVDGAGPISVEKLREFCRDAGLSPAKFPQDVVVVDAMPKTPTMKIRKQSLRETVIKRYAATGVPAM